MLTFILAIRNFFLNEEGVTAIEYALIAALIAVAIIAAVTLLGTELDAIFRDICAKIKGSAC